MVKVARDKNGKLVWIRGRTDISPMPYSVVRQMMRQPIGAIVRKKGGREEFEAPFTISEEDLDL